MTSPADLVTCDACPARRSTLPFNLADMIAVRLLPAQFARVLGVSKQAVSKWIHAGKVTLGPDGRLDPAKAIQEVLKNTAPTRLRARIFRQAMEGADAMRVELRALQRKVAGLEQELAASERACGLAVAEVRRRDSSATDAVAAAQAAGDAATRVLLAAFRRALVVRFDQVAAERAKGYADLAWALEEIESEVISKARVERGHGAALQS